jgi:hypothetical protein
MITRVALKIGEDVVIGEEKLRHDSLYSEEIISRIRNHEPHIQGFVTDTGEFLDRKQSADHAFKCGQMSELTDCLVSEDLW